jgi:hypothetical protein
MGAVGVGEVIALYPLPTENSQSYLLQNILKQSPKKWQNSRKIMYSQTQVSGV